MEKNDVREEMVRRGRIKETLRMTVKLPKKWKSTFKTSHKNPASNWPK